MDGMFNLIFQHILQHSIDFKLVSDSCYCYPFGDGVLNSTRNVVELQQHSPLSNNTSVTTYVHRMIISLPYLFKHMNNDESVPMLFQCLLDQDGPGSSSGKALGCGLDDPGSIQGVGGVEIFLHTFMPRLVLGSTQPPIK